MRQKKDIIRIGDTVQIVVPKAFVRCGYPMSLKDESKKILESMGKEIRLLVQRVAIAPEQHCLPVSLWTQNVDVPSERIASILAYEKMKAAHFGGRERRVYEEEKPELAGKSTVVISIRFVKTGTYVRGGWSGGEYDEYDPSCLSDEKTVKILELSDPHIEIDARHVLKTRSGFQW